MCKKTHQSRYRKRGPFCPDAASPACASGIACRQAFFFLDAAGAASPLCTGRSAMRAFFSFDAAGAASQACARCVSSQQAFFSFDAAFAIVLCVAAFAGFSLLLSSAASSASASASSHSSSLLALRFSSFVLSESQAQGPLHGAGQYYKSHELDLARLSLIDLHAARLGMGRGFASILVAGSNGTAYSASDGEAKGEVYCTRRLALLEGKMVRLEACVS